MFTTINVTPTWGGISGGFQFYVTMSCDLEFLQHLILPSLEMALVVGLSYCDHELLQQLILPSRVVGLVVAFSCV